MAKKIAAQEETNKASAAAALALTSATAAKVAEEAAAAKAAEEAAAAKAAEEVAAAKAAEEAAAAKAAEEAAAAKAAEEAAMLKAEQEANKASTTVAATAIAITSATASVALEEERKRKEQIAKANFKPIVFINYNYNQEKNITEPVIKEFKTDQSVNKTNIEFKTKQNVSKEYYTDSIKTIDSTLIPKTFKFPQENTNFHNSYENFFVDGEKNQQLFLFGPSGAGKTFTAKEMSKYFIKNNYKLEKIDIIYGEIDYTGKINEQNFLHDIKCGIFNVKLTAELNEDNRFVFNTPEYNTKCINVSSDLNKSYKNIRKNLDKKFLDCFASTITRHNKLLNLLINQKNADTIDLNDEYNKQNLDMILEAIIKKYNNETTTPEIKNNIKDIPNKISLLDVTSYFLKYLGFILQTINNLESSRCAVSYTYNLYDKQNNLVKSRTILDAPGSENANAILNAHYRNYNDLKKQYGIIFDENNPQNELQNIIIFNGSSSDNNNNLKNDLRTHSSLISFKQGDNDTDKNNKIILKQDFKKNFINMIKIYTYIKVYLKIKTIENYDPTKNVISAKYNYINCDEINNILLPGFSMDTTLKNITKLEDIIMNDYKFIDKKTISTLITELDNIRKLKLDNVEMELKTPNAFNDDNDDDKETTTTEKDDKETTTTGKNNKLYYDYMKLIIRQSFYILPLISEMKRETYKNFKSNKKNEFEEYIKFLKQTQPTSFLYNDCKLDIAVELGRTFVGRIGPNNMYRGADVPLCLYITNKYNIVEPQNVLVSNLNYNSNDYFIKSLNTSSDELEIENNHNNFFPFKYNNTKYTPIVILPTHRTSITAVTNTINGTIMLLDQLLGKTEQEMKVFQEKKKQDIMVKFGNKIQELTNFLGKGMENLKNIYVIDDYKHEDNQITEGGSKNKNSIKKKRIKTIKKYRYVKNKTGKKRKKSEKIKIIKKNKNKMKISQAIIKHL